MWRRWVGIALLWASLAALLHVSRAEGGALASVVAGVGFLGFAAGLSLILDELKRAIVEQLRGDRTCLERAA